MEKLKNDEKAKRANYPDYYSQGCAFTVIGLMFLLLTLITSYKSLTILLLPELFLNLSLIIGAGLFLLLAVVLAVWSNSNKIRRIILITAILLLFSAFVFREISVGIFFVIGILFSWPYAILRFIPAIVYPLFLIGTFFFAILCWQKSLTLPRSDVKKTTYALILLTVVFSLGHAWWLWYGRYDEGIKIGNSTYHAVEVGTTFDSPGDSLLYKCRFDYVGCRLISVGYRVLYRTNFVYDENTGVLRLQAQRHSTVAPYTVHEIHIQQE